MISREILIGRTPAKGLDKGLGRSREPWDRLDDSDLLTELDFFVLRCETFSFGMQDLFPVNTIHFMKEA